MSLLETDGEERIATMTTTTTTVQKRTQPQNSEQQQITCRYCSKPETSITECRKRIRKEQEHQGQKQTNETPITKTNIKCPLCQKTNHTADVRWNGTNAADRPKRYKTENPTDSKDESHKYETCTQNALSSILRNSLR